MPNLFGRPLWSYLPMGNIIYGNEMHSSHGTFETIFHVSYAVAGLTYCCAYPIMVKETKSFNPVSQVNTYIEQSQRYKELNNQIFGPGGFADTNFDKTVDLNEKANAYKKLGFKDFPKQDLKLEQLEELVKKYME